MNPLAQAVKAHFGEAGVHFTQSDDGRLFLAPFSLCNGNALLMVVCQEEQQRLIVHVVLPFQAPASRRLAVAELITRVNYGLAQGSFDMDFTDGELRYRAAIDVTEDRLTPALVGNLVGCCLNTTDQFYRPLAAVAFGGLEPLAALAVKSAPVDAPPSHPPLYSSPGLTVDPRDRLN